MVLKNSSYIFLITTTLFSQVLYSENPAKENTNLEYSLLLKRQTYSYLPYQFTSFTEKNDLTSTNQTERLQQNSKVLIPFVFSLENKSKGYRFELSYFEIEIVNANANVLQNQNGVLNYTRQYLSPVARSEFEINGYKSLELTPKITLYGGGGIRNINRYLYGNYIGEGAFREYFFTYGPQASIKIVYLLPYDFEFKFDMDLFYTQGNRFLKNPNVMNDSLIYSLNTSATEGVFRGYETEVSFAYKFSSNLKIYFGYNMITSRFGYKNLHQINLSQPVSLGSNSISNNATLSVTVPRLSENFDSLRGVYFGLMVLF